MPWRLATLARLEPHRDLVHTKPGCARFWSENQTSFDEPFRSYVAAEFAKTLVPSDAATAPADQGAFFGQSLGKDHVSGRG
jgi:hypothetical protein